MSNFVYITLDTTAPANPVVTIAGGALAVSNQLVQLAISVDDADKTGYQMLIWGDVDTTYDTKVQATEATSQWQAYSASPQVKLSAGDASKTINVRVRDAVNNPSNVAVDSVNLDATIPTITVTYSATTISEQSGKDTFSFTFQSSDAFTDYKVMLVTSTGATDTQGTQIPVTNGSTNVSGTGSFLSSTVTTVTLKAQDLRLAGANMNAQNIIKPFVKNQAGVWSA